MSRGLFVRETDGTWKRGGRIPEVIAPDSPAGSVLYADDCTGSSTASYNNQIDKTWFVENAGYSITRGNGVVKNDSATNFRMWSKVPYGGPGNDIRINFDFRATQITGDSDAVIEGVKLLTKWVAPIHTGSGGIDNPDNARGIDPWPHPTTEQSMTPGSISYTPTNYTGRVEISKRPWGAGTSDYIFPTSRTNGSYVVGQWITASVQFRWLDNGLETTSFYNGVQDLGPWVDTRSPGTPASSGGEAFMWKCFPGFRADDSLFEIRNFEVVAV